MPSTDRPIEPYSRHISPLKAWEHLACPSEYTFQGLAGKGAVGHVADR